MRSLLNPYRKYDSICTDASCKEIIKSLYKYYKNFDDVQQVPNEIRNACADYIVFLIINEQIEDMIETHNKFIELLMGVKNPLSFSIISNAFKTTLEKSTKEKKQHYMKLFETINFKNCRLLEPCYDHLKNELSKK